MDLEGVVRYREKLCICLICNVFHGGDMDGVVCLLNDHGQVLVLIS
jgi:hypothetical protein